MASLYVNTWMEDSRYLFDIKDLITVYIYNLSDTNDIKLKFKSMSQKPTNQNMVGLDLGNVEYEIVEDVPELTTLCRWPVILLDNYVISGLCSVARYIIKNSCRENVRNLLGFREANLVSCAEVSVWTKFCEVDIIETVEGVLKNSCLKKDVLAFPEAILKYELHLSKPVKVHNIFKIARDMQNNQSLQASKERIGVEIHHDFAEGPYILLSDLILYPCFQIIFQYFENNLWLPEFKSKIPLISDWIEKVGLADFSKLRLSLPCNTIGSDICINSIIMPIVDDVSLYRADNTKVYNQKYTKQYKIDEALNCLGNILNGIENDQVPYGFDVEFHWDKVPLEINPKGGSLPNSRAHRKCEQLENLTKAVIKLVKNKRRTIVDFCSGSGHLGLLIAYLIPNSQIVLVENKEKSLERAKNTISKLNLKNVVVAQTNLDYFVGKFDVGVALHACGVATDLVLKMCIKNQADFICCPCCYGGIKNCHEITYPLSSLYKNQVLNNENGYFDLAHAADQTHEDDNVKTKQGYLCMDVIDNDRKCFAEERGYAVCLGKLQPTSCTNKNNLLVGINGW